MPTQSTDPRQLQAHQAAFAKVAANQAAARQAAPQGKMQPGAQAYAPTAVRPAQAANYQQAMARVPVQAPQLQPGLVAPAVMQRPGGQPGLFSGGKILPPGVAPQVPQIYGNQQSLPIAQPSVSNAQAQAAAAQRSNQANIQVSGTQPVRAAVSDPQAQAAAAQRSNQASMQAAQQADALARNHALNGVA